MKCMKRLICIIFMLAICITGMSGCAERLPDGGQPDTSYHSRLVGLGGHRVFCWDQYVVSEWDDGFYDRVTGEIRFGFCEDPACEQESCPWRQTRIHVLTVEDGKLYFYAHGKRELYYGYRDMLTGEIAVLLTQNAEQRTPNQPTFLADGWLYYEIKLLREGGDPDNADDYLAHLCRIPKDGGKQEIVYEMRRNAEILLLVADGWMYTYLDSTIWKFDLTDMTCRELFAFEDSGLNSGLADFCYLDGRLYFYTVKHDGDYLYTMNPDTGEIRCLLDIPLRSYTITNDAVYFSPKEVRQVSDPTRYTPEDEDTKFFSFSPTLFACDLDGGNVRDVWTDESGLIDFGQQYTVVDGVFYGWVNEFDLEKNASKARYFAEIHLATGEIIPATVVK